MAILRELELSREEAFERLGIPLPAPTAKLTPNKQLPAPTALDMVVFEAALAKLLSSEELTKPAFEKALKMPQVDASLPHLERGNI